MCDHLGVLEEWTEKAKEKTTNKYILSFLSYQYAVFLPFYGSLSTEERVPYTKRIKKLRFLLSYGKTKKIKLIRFAVGLLGINEASKLLHRYVMKRDEANA